MYEGTGEGEPQHKHTREEAEENPQRREALPQVGAGSLARSRKTLPGEIEQATFCCWRSSSHARVSAFFLTLQILIEWFSSTGSTTSTV